MAAENRFQARALPYDYTELAPYVSEQTLRFHHDKHYTGYVAKLNELVAGTPHAEQTLEEIVRTAEGALFNNAAQAWNHEFYFEALAAGGEHEPSGELEQALVAEWGSVAEFQRCVAAAAAGLFGSGWVWLSEDKAGKLRIDALSNAGNPLREGCRPLLCIDVWEHAYYLDYQNRRPDSVEAFWHIVDWKVVAARYAK